VVFSIHNSEGYYCENHFFVMMLLVEW